jgi:hypothetical protein
MVDTGPSYAVRPELRRAALHDLAGDVVAGRRILAETVKSLSTFLDGQRIVSPRALEDGATTRLGRRASAVFRTDAAHPTETEAGND